MVSMSLPIFSSIFLSAEALLSLGEVGKLCAEENYDNATELIAKKLEMKEADILDLACATVGQFSNILYCRIRNKRFTASRCYDLLNTIKRVATGKTGIKALNRANGYYDYL